MNPVERKIKNIPIAEPWSKQVMGNAIRGELIDNELVVYIECRSNKYGRKLKGIVQNLGMENLKFFRN